MQPHQGSSQNGGDTNIYNHPGHHANLHAQMPQMQPMMGYHHQMHPHAHHMYGYRPTNQQHYRPQAGPPLGYMQQQQRMPYTPFMDLYRRFQQNPQMNSQMSPGSQTTQYIGPYSHQQPVNNQASSLLDSASTPSSSMQVSPVHHVGVAHPNASNMHNASGGSNMHNASGGSSMHNASGASNMHNASGASNMHNASGASNMHGLQSGPPSNTSGMGCKTRGSSTTKNLSHRMDSSSSSVDSRAAAAQYSAVKHGMPPHQSASTGMVYGAGNAFSMYGAHGGPSPTQGGGSGSASMQPWMMAGGLNHMQGGGVQKVARRPPSRSTNDYWKDDDEDDYEAEVGGDIDDDDYKPRHRSRRPSKSVGSSSSLRSSRKDFILPSNSTSNSLIGKRRRAKQPMSLKRDDTMSSEEEILEQRKSRRVANRRIPFGEIPSDDEPANIEELGDVDESESDEGIGRRRKVEPCVLDYPTAAGLPHSGVDKVVSHRDLGAEGRRYEIKWVGKSHLKNTWATLEELQALQVNGIKKVTNYMKKQSDIEMQKKILPDDQIEHFLIDLELQRQLDQDATIVERIVTQYTPDEGPVIYLVKWTSCSYDKCTWETQEFLEEKGFSEFIAKFHTREELIYGQTSQDHPLNQHDLSETSFEPYIETPAFLGNPHDKFELRDYQLNGVNWIVSRMKKDLSVLLADEMGLGKTVQTITVIGHMIYVEKVAGPFLVVVPQSTMDNWMSEFQHWLPDINVIIHHGNPMSREIIRREEMKIVNAYPMSKVAFDSFVKTKGKLNVMTPAHLRNVIYKRVRYRFDVVITTPSLLQCNKDVDYLKQIPWYLMVVDEAHQLKNRDSKRFKGLSMFKPKYKLLLSGTPLHNNLEELWSLLHFINPTIYDHFPLFQQKYSEIENTHSVGVLKTKQLQQLEQELREVVLRRIKKAVLKSLPHKIERILRVELSPKQASLCKDVVLRNYEALSKTTNGSRTSLQNICVELKKICNHPFLLHCPEDRETFDKELVWSSGKMCLLDQLLTRLKEKGSRVLIFSQMVRMLNILSTFMNCRGYRHQRLDGTMSRDVRKKAMDHFNAPNSDDFCFLLSTKAGGLGINLTSADTVIIYDSDWNPQNDLQAEARAHRIGQTKTVQIYRIVTKDSVEEDILERAKAKMVLDALVVQGLNVNAGQQGADLLNGGGTTANKASAFSIDDLTKILKFGATKLWRKGDNNPSGLTSNGFTTDGEALKIDLDEVLKDAETHTSSSDSGRAADLLSSFQNVTDFRYEAPKFKDDGKLGWDSIIPLEERTKLDKVKDELIRPVVAETRTRKAATRAAKRRQVTADENDADGDFKTEEIASEDDMDEEDVDEDDPTTDDDHKTPTRATRSLRRRTAAAAAASSAAGTRKSRSAKRPKRASSVAAVKMMKTEVTSLISASNDNGFGDRERYRLFRAMTKFGHPRIRIQEILDDAKLGKVDTNVLCDEADDLIARCNEQLLASRTTTTAPGSRKNVVTTISLGTGYTCHCRELVERVQLLGSLHEYVCSLNDNHPRPWELGSADLLLTLPDNCLIKHGDSNLLKGIYIHGFANWQKISTDAAVAEGVPDFAKKVKSDKIKSRATRLLSFVNDLISSDNTKNTADETVPTPVRITVAKIPKKQKKRLIAAPLTESDADEDAEIPSQNNITNQSTGQYTTMAAATLSAYNEEEEEGQLMEHVGEQQQATHQHDVATELSPQNGIPTAAHDQELATMMIQKGLEKSVLNLDAVNCGADTHTGTHTGDTGRHTGDTGRHTGDTGRHTGDTGTHTGDTGTHTGEKSIFEDAEQVPTGEGSPETRKINSTGDQYCEHSQFQAVQPNIEYGHQQNEDAMMLDAYPTTLADKFQVELPNERVVGGTMAQDEAQLPCDKGSGAFRAAELCDYQNEELPVTSECGMKTSILEEVSGDNEHAGKGEDIRSGLGLFDRETALDCEA